MDGSLDVLNYIERLQYLENLILKKFIIPQPKIIEVVNKIPANVRSIDLSKSQITFTDVIYRKVSNILKIRNNLIIKVSRETCKNVKNIDKNIVIVV